MRRGVRHRFSHMLSPLPLGMLYVVEIHRQQEIFVVFLDQWDTSGHKYGLEIKSLGSALCKNELICSRVLIIRIVTPMKDADHLALNGRAFSVLTFFIIEFLCRWKLFSTNVSTNR